MKHPAWLVIAAILAAGAEKVFADELATSLTVWTGGPKPAFILEDTNRAEVSLDALRGQPVLVHFFATWCEPCRDELPALQRLVERTSPTRLRVLAISVAEPDARVRNFLARTPANFSVVLDRNRAVAKSWSVSALPTTFILDRDLKPRLFIERGYDWDRFNSSDFQ